jgi:hypothetical protein
MGTSLKRFILWDYARGSWQYDLVVALILVFIFLTPREIFRDQPHAQSVVLLPSDKEGQDEVFYLEPRLLEDAPEAERFAKASQLVKKQDGKRLELYRLTPIFDSEQDIKGYMAYTRPAK